MNKLVTNQNEKFCLFCWHLTLIWFMHLQVWYQPPASRFAVINCFSICFTRWLYLDLADFCVVFIFVFTLHSLPGFPWWRASWSLQTVDARERVKIGLNINWKNLISTLVEIVLQSQDHGLDLNSLASCWSGLQLHTFIHFFYGRVHQLKAKHVNVSSLCCIRQLFFFLGTIYLYEDTRGFVLLRGI